MAKDVTFKIKRWMVKELGIGLELNGNDLLCYSFLYEFSKKDGNDVLHIDEVSNAINEDKSMCYSVLMVLQGKGLISFDKNGDKDVFTFKILPKECMAQSVSKRKVTPKDDALFEECWIAYDRKGHKNKAKPYWDKLQQDVRERIMPHIKAYVSVRERSFQQDFERYLKDKTYDTVVYNRNDVIYDPKRLTDKETYRPVVDGFNMSWNEPLQCYLTFDFIDDLIDGYKKETRPDGAHVYSKGKHYIWSAEQKKWIARE